jgi:hypothetical protein
LKQEARSKKQEAGSEKQEARSRKREAGSEKQEARSRKQGARIFVAALPAVFIPAPCSPLPSYHPFRTT